MSETDSRSHAHNMSSKLLSISHVNLFAYPTSQSYATFSSQGADMQMGSTARRDSSEGADRYGPSVLASVEGIGPERCSLADGRAQFHCCERVRLQATKAACLSPSNTGPSVYQRTNSCCLTPPPHNTTPVRVSPQALRTSKCTPPSTRDQRHCCT